MSNDVSLDINQESNPVQTVAPPKEDNNMLRATDKITALYCRLSVEDTKEKGGKDDPSNSIQHQQIMLMEYERFAMMSKNYTEEQKDLKAEVKNLQQQIHEQEQQAESIEQFVQRVKRNSTLTELTPYALRELVKAVYVEAPDKSSGKRRQKVHIEYDLVGYIPVDELLKAEQA